MANLFDGYAFFKAGESVFNDGNESCYAELQILLGTVRTRTYGKAGQGLHAEMDALNNFLKSLQYNVRTVSTYGLQIDCEDKPCCLKCSTVLGALGVAPGLKTYKSPHNMGKTQWCLPPDFRTFLVQCGFTKADVNQLCSLVN